MPGKENNAAISSAVVGRSPCLVREFYVIIIIIIIIPSVCALPLVYLLPVYIYRTCLDVVIYLFYHPPTSPFTGKSTLSSYYEQ